MGVQAIFTVNILENIFFCILVKEPELHLRLEC